MQTWLRRIVASVAVLLVAIGLGAVTLRGAAQGNAEPPLQAGPPPLEPSQLPALIAAAKAEGRLTLIAFPQTWANYGQIISEFQSTFGIDVEVLSPNATSAQELTALRMMKGQSRMPDIVEVGSAFAQQAIDQRLIQPYRVSVWDQIPAQLKDPNGYWTAPYYGLISFGTNTNKVPTPPTSWKELNSPTYRGALGLNGDPRSATSALSAVWSAALANGGSLNDIQPGIDYFGTLSHSGVYVPLQANVANLANQQITVAADWTFNMPGAKSVLAQSGIDYAVTTPSDGLFGGYYADAVTAGAPHPNAAKLWMEWVLALKGRELYLTGGAIPSLYPQMVASGQVPAEVQATLPPVEQLRTLQFPTDAEQTAASTQVLSQWNSAVGQ